MMSCKARDHQRPDPCSGRAVIGYPGAVNRAHNPDLRTQPVKGRHEPSGESRGPLECVTVGDPLRPTPTLTTVICATNKVSHAETVGTSMSWAGAGSAAGSPRGWATWAADG